MTRVSCSSRSPTFSSVLYTIQLVVLILDQKMSLKRKYNELSIDKKKEILDLSDQKMGQRKIAEMFGVSKSTVANIVNSRQVIMEMWDSNCNDERKRKLRKTDNEQINVTVLKFFEMCRSNDIPVTGPILQEKSLEIAERLGMKDFKGSNGWLESFLKRNNIIFKTLCGDAAGADLEVAEDWKRNKLQSLLKKYDLKDCFNADESALFYRQVPRKSFVHRIDKCKAPKMAKERLSVLLCCNSFGEKFKPLVIGNAKCPRIFKKGKINANNLPVTWNFNKKAWMTKNIFDQWLLDVNKQMKRQKRKILLLVDNASSHKTSKKFSNVEVVFLPPNLTSEIQPLDQGIIRAVKARYRSKMLRFLIAMAEKNCSKEEFIKSVTVLHAIRWLNASWNEIHSSTFEKCFRRSGFPVAVKEAVTNVNEEAPLMEILQTLPNDFLTIDEMEKQDQQLIVHEVVPTTLDEALDQVVKSFLEPQEEDEFDAEAEEEEEEPTEAIECLSYDEALKSVKALIQFGDKSEIDVQYLYEFYNAVESKWLSSAFAAKQTKITDFFKL